MKKAAPLEPVNSDKKFWTIKDAARYLGISQYTVYDWLKPNRKAPRPSSISEMPPIYRFGKRRGLRFNIKEFVEWAENFREGSK